MLFSVSPWNYFCVPVMLQVVCDTLWWHDRSQLHYVCTSQGTIPCICILSLQRQQTHIYIISYHIVPYDNMDVLDTHSTECPVHSMRWYNMSTITANKMDIMHPTTLPPIHILGWYENTVKYNQATISEIIWSRKIAIFYDREHEYVFLKDITS